MKDVVKFLKANGFKFRRLSSYPVYSNNKCDIVIYDDHYDIIDDEGKTCHSINLNIYWLIGVLTYYGYMDKNYK